MKVVIRKYEEYPRDEPTGYAVGFNIEASNGKGFYLDTLVSFKDAEGLNEEEIAELAYGKIRRSAEELVEKEEGKPSILGSEIDTTKLAPLPSLSEESEEVEA